jgi:predicted ATPase/transcriptional regulator with XRE-family HTH domain
MATDPSSTPLPFGELLRQLRVAAGLTQEALAERAGLSARGLSDLERGVRAAPRRDTLDLLVAALPLGSAERAALVAAARRSAAAAARPRAVSPRTDRGTGVRFPGAALPMPADPLVGREREVDALTALLEDPGGRLLTLTGPGGVGKSRLALEVARSVRDAFPGGVAFVPLAAIRDAALVLPTVARVLGVREMAERTAEEALAVALGGRRALLVLDNLEQVLDAAPALGRLLGAAPELRILATSRAPLRLNDEQRYPVPPLATPDPVPAQPDALVDNPAVRLFAQRARRVRPDFALTPDTADAVARICRRLDGLPLAIELAAARVAVLSPSALLLRLERTLPLLSGGSRDQPARLQTMREAVAWSYELLPLAEQSLFRQVAVFAGGFSLEAAAAVWRPDGAAEAAPFEGIAGLVEASLLQAGDGPGGEPRFSLFETVREYGAEQLAAAGEEGPTRERQAAWVLGLAEAAEPQLFRAEQQRWRKRLEAERPNIRATLAWFEEVGDAERAQRLTASLLWFGIQSGSLREGQDWLRRALAIPGSGVANARGWALVGAGIVAWFLGDYDRAWALTEEGQAVAREADFALGAAVAEATFAEIAWMRGDVADALALGEEAIGLLREAGEPGWLAIPLADMGTAALLSGDRERGEAWSAESLALNRTLGNRWFIAVHLSDLGVVAHGRGDLAEAARHYAESVRLLAEAEDAWYVASPLAGLAAIAAETGDPVRAARLLGAAAELRDTSGFTVLATEQERDERTAAAARRALGEERYGRALAAGRSLPLAQSVAEAVASGGEAGPLDRASARAARGVPPSVGLTRKPTRFGHSGWRG